MGRSTKTGHTFRMIVIYVAKSASLQTWASDVGLTKNIYKLGVSEEPAAKAVAALNAARHAGRTDWTLVKAQDAADADEDAALSRLGRKEIRVDPTYYAQLKGAGDIFKVKLANAENHFIIESALAGRERKAKKVSTAEIGTYLIRNALAGGGER